jgi:retinol-binding protein 3
MMRAPSMLHCLAFGMLLGSPVSTLAQQPPASPGRSLDAAARTAVIDGLIEKLNSKYVFPDIARQMEKATRARQANKEYDPITNGPEFARRLTDDLRQVCHDQHLGVEYSPDELPYDAEKPPDAEVVKLFRERGKQANYEFRKVERLDGGVGLLQLDGFYPGEWTGDTLAAAMSFLANSEAIILDLRQNHGGFGNGGTWLCSYFFEEETHLTDQYNRPENTTRQVWTFPVAPSARLADRDLYILTSRETFSAPEWLAYTMQALKRATIVGETTGGGAHGTTMYRIADHFSASIPFNRMINPVTKTDWEGVGVKPDVAVPANQALLTAHLLALKKALHRHADDADRAERLKRAIAAKEQELAALKAKPAVP